MAIVGRAFNRDRRCLRSALPDRERCGIGHALSAAIQQDRVSRLYDRPVDLCQFIPRSCPGFSIAAVSIFRNVIGLSCGKVHVRIRSAACDESNPHAHENEQHIEKRPGAYFCVPPLKCMYSHLEQHHPSSKTNLSVFLSMHYPSFIREDGPVFGRVTRGPLPCDVPDACPVNRNETAYIVLEVHLDHFAGVVERRQIVNHPVGNGIDDIAYIPDVEEPSVSAIF